MVVGGRDAKHFLFRKRERSCGVCLFHCCDSLISGEEENLLAYGSSIAAPGHLFSRWSHTGAKNRPSIMHVCLPELPTFWGELPHTCRNCPFLPRLFLYRNIERKNLLAVFYNRKANLAEDRRCGTAIAGIKKTTQLPVLTPLSLISLPDHRCMEIFRSILTWLSRYRYSCLFFIHSELE